MSSRLPGSSHTAMRHPALLRAYSSPLFEQTRPSVCAAPCLPICNPQSGMPRRRRPSPVADILRFASRGVNTGRESKGPSAQVVQWPEAVSRRQICNPALSRPFDRLRAGSERSERVSTSTSASTSRRSRNQSAISNLQCLRMGGDVKWKRIGIEGSSGSVVEWQSAESGPELALGLAVGLRLVAWGCGAASPCSRLMA